MAAAQHAEPFSALVSAIVSQQLSTKAASTIHRRVLELVGRPPKPRAILAAADEGLRAAGLSRQKIAYLRDLSVRALDVDGSVPLERLSDLGDEEVIAALTRIKGIGRWTAEMFLMFQLHRPDILPVGDLGITRAIQTTYKLRKPPDARRMFKIAEPWRPYRSVASWYLWRSLGNDPKTEV